MCNDCSNLFRLCSSLILSTSNDLGTVYSFLHTLFIIIETCGDNFSSILTATSIFLSIHSSRFIFEYAISVADTDGLGAIGGLDAIAGFGATVGLNVVLVFGAIGSLGTEAGSERTLGLGGIAGFVDPGCVCEDENALLWMLIVGGH